jgi:hypothetical protein
MEAVSLKTGLFSVVPRRLQISPFMVRFHEFGYMRYAVVTENAMECGSVDYAVSMNVETQLFNLNRRYCALLAMGIRG